jgi:choline kinase
MRFIVYAAGQNRRFASTLNDIPKGLTNVGSKMLIEYGLSWMVRYNPSEIIIVVGYKKELFYKVLGKSYKGIPIKYVYNKYYNLHGNMSSLWVAREYCDEDTIFTVSDLICNRNNIDMFMSNKSSSKILVDRNKKLFSDPDPVKVSLSDNGEIKKILKKMELEEIDGIAIGIYMLSKEMIGLLLEIIENYFSADNYNLSLYYAINDLVKDKPIVPVYCDGSHWCDVDTPKELEMLNTILQDQHYY